MQHGLSWTPITNTIINVNNSAVVNMDVHDSNVTGLSLQFGYEHYAQAHLKQSIQMNYL